MKNLHLKIIIASIAIIVPLSGLLFFVERITQKKSEARFNTFISNFKIGMPYSEAENSLGKTFKTLTEQKDVEEWGDCKDSKITSECNLHMFLRMDVIPHRFILIYEDKNTHTIRRVSLKHT